MIDPTRVGSEYWMKKNKPDVGIDARRFGNYMRFINQDEKRGSFLVILANCKAVTVLYENRWHDVFVATKDISSGNELFIYHKL
jgi:SET domain-containing protein